MKVIEYFIPRLNGWIKLSLDDYLSILFSQEDKKFSKIKIPKGLPIINADSSSISQEEISLSPENYIEILIKKNIILVSKNEKGRLKISNEDIREKEPKEYEVWARGKIISNDLDSKILLVELNDEIIIIDNMELIRPIKEIKQTQNTLLAYNIKQILSNDYNLIKNEFDQLLATNSDDNKLFYINYDVINTSLFCLGNKDDLNNLLLLKQYEERYKKIDNISNSNNNKNLIGLGNKRPSEKMENIGLFVNDGIKNEYKFKITFTFRDKFKKDLEKSFKKNLQKCKFHMGKNNDNNFDMILYGNNRDEFMEEKNKFEKEFKQSKIESDVSVDKKVAKELAKKSNIKYIDIENKNIYLIGNENNINNFKDVWDLTNDYSRDFLKISKENENIQKELETLKKRHKFK